MKKQLAVLLLSFASIVHCSSENKEKKAKKKQATQYNEITKISWRNLEEQQIVSLCGHLIACSKHNDCKSESCIGNGKAIHAAHHNRTSKIYYADTENLNRTNTISGDEAKKMYQALKKEEKKQERERQENKPGMLMKSARH